MDREREREREKGRIVQRLAKLRVYTEEGCVCANVCARAYVGVWVSVLSVGATGCACGLGVENLGLGILFVVSHPRGRFLKISFSQPTPAQKSASRA